MRRMLDWFRLAHYCYFSSPAHERVVYRTIRRNRARKILELGLGQGRRAQRMIDVAMRGVAEPVSYAGIDLFELRSPDDDRLSLKQAHALLKPSGARVRLVPGDPFAAFARMANEIGPCDLIVIAADQPSEPLDRAWFYVPRLLHAATTVLREVAGSTETPARYERIAHDEIHRRAAECGVRRRAA